MYLFDTVAEKACTFVSLIIAQMDNRGNRLLVTDDSSAINTPAVSAGHVVKRYQAQAPDELTLQVSDVINCVGKSLWRSMSMQLDWSTFSD